MEFDDATLAGGQDRTIYRSTSPTIMLMSPPTRSCRSGRFAIVSMKRFMAGGIQERQDAFQHEIQRESREQICPVHGAGRLNACRSDSGT